MTTRKLWRPNFGALGQLKEASFANSARFQATGWESFMVKPNGRLVRVSSRIAALPPPAYQSRSLRLAFLDRRSGLGKPYLGASFSLRCFQRLSLPDFATERCHWRDNSITRGLFIPVLSY